jgi:hypothetical protein
MGEAFQTVVQSSSRTSARPGAERKGLAATLRGARIAAR